MSADTEFTDTANQVDVVAAAIRRALTIQAADLLAYFERRVAHHDAPDLVSEVMVTAWRRAGVLPAEPEQARMWLFGIARNVLANAARADRRRWRLAGRLQPERFRPHVLSAPAADDGDEVRDAVARLRPDDAELIRLVHWDGFSVAETAVLLGIPASTARSRHQRIKEQLRAVLSG